MVPRGEVGIIFAEFGRLSEIFDETLYTIMIAVVAFTTLAAPFFLKSYVKKWGFLVLKPEVHKRWLYFVSGFLWLGVGLFLCLRAFFWLKQQGLKGFVIMIFALLLSYPAGRLGLARIASRNLKRLDKKPERICCFAFQPWRSYLIICVMVFLGVALRRSSLPRPLLGFLYALMGGGLVTASWLYFEGGIKRFRKPNP